MMYENKLEIQKAILVGLDTGEYKAEESLDELEELADTAGASVVGRMLQKREEPDAAVCIGRGRLVELKEAIQVMDANLVIFDLELTGIQLRNLEQELDVPIIDRTMLILDIFSSHAVTEEGKLQVALAQQRYLLPRLIGMGESLSRLGGGIGTRGPGETKLETDRRHIRRQIRVLERKLQNLEERRGRLRLRRKKDQVITAALIGYTNVGKSTLFNMLTGANVLSEDKLFATLDPTSRSLTLPDGRNILLIDTVGFIRRLPHHLIEAFHSTLEEAAEADLILNVCDLSDPNCLNQLEIAGQLMDDLGAGNIPVITVFNKCDKISVLPFPCGKGSVLCSAKTGFGLERLISAIQKSLPPSQKRLRLLIPYTQGGLVNEIMQNGKIFSKEYTESGILLDALTDKRILYKFDNMVLPN